MVLPHLSAYSESRIVMVGFMQYLLDSCGTDMDLSVTWYRVVIISVGSGSSESSREITATFLSDSSRHFEVAIATHARKNAHTR
jgi:hypothetical protein